MCRPHGEPGREVKAGCPQHSRHTSTDDLPPFMWHQNQQTEGARGRKGWVLLGEQRGTRALSGATKVICNMNEAFVKIILINT